MKIKNLKVNTRVVSKLATCVLGGTIAATALTGCGEKTTDKNNLLKGTILENTCLVTFKDGSKDIAVVDSVCDSADDPHYYSVTSGIYFGSEECTDKDFRGKNIHHYAITDEDIITKYLTSEELEKAVQGKLDNNDIVAIVNRVIVPTTEETKAKTK